ncbi:hypothetical protein [Pannonibacter phragmitetus]|uniref:hypothetical protein n=1 Tax=Pannonibacter phragmitetus TaxID=121719 RepID=UPI003D2F28EE
MAIKYEYQPQRAFTPFPSDHLPEGFVYPAHYLEHAKSLSYPMNFIWWFNDCSNGIDPDWDLRLHWQSEGWRYMDEIDPIPFARNGDWAAFFDGNDRNGDPKVVVVDLGNKMNSYKLSNFDVWLHRALQDSGLI